MRVAILSDIHGNPRALDAALADVRSLGEIDAYWLLGDFAGLGYDPVTPLETVTALPHASFTRGNTDRYVVTDDLPLPPEMAQQDPALLPTVLEFARSFSWTRGYVTSAGWLEAPYPRTSIAMARKPAAASAGSWWRQDHQPSGKP